MSRVECQKKFRRRHVPGTKTQTDGLSTRKVGPLKAERTRYCWVEAEVYSAQEQLPESWSTNWSSFEVSKSGTHTQGG